jgi:RimJ/RimL family protein N-acetyltransferase
MSDVGPARPDVAIRDVEDDDIELFFAHQLDPEATAMAAFPARDHAAFTAHWAKIRADETVCQVTILADGRVAGNVGSWERSGRQLVGYWIDRRDWGRGIATKALALFLDRMTVRPVHAYVAVANVGSIRVLQKCGFRQVTLPDGQATATAEDGVEEMLLMLAAD